MFIQLLTCSIEHGDWLVDKYKAQPPHARDPRTELMGWEMDGMEDSDATPEHPCFLRQIIVTG